MKNHLQFIGIVHSPLMKLEDCPLQENEESPVATIEVFDDFIEGTSDIQPGLELILFSWLHRANRSVLKTHPRNNRQAALTGVFSTRSPDRPNPIGIHFVKVLTVLSKNEFQVSALELLDQTPIIDIKPNIAKR
ncbi:tRNA (N6-threonylcarbamoyladenosine(37)-N6)-methyltransferase TrmO [Pedobacter sp. HMF7647]|uniref:tRNA (N6-threonylcarbamoyladenosine(37)-N6)-methyltransferase TrmO n=1 Tax=Hufsiella arboris TaxID=2695275 RepID=A0A7K1Y5T3_9SPHI|nr:tRNA (N6-threonylcarbamoyladenosine(37)-N6)-methyltransferase TrmO [Hufsiella arboris]MXV49800.1 tRNA (N6-threonylcarbamoyladenosine(37)-N6)-methyltransferase TrmO [Hufsiella arboris]